MQKQDAHFSAPMPDIRMLLGQKRPVNGPPQKFIDFMVEAGVDNLRTIRHQWDLLMNGERGVRIHDAAFIAWSRCGGVV